ncbi:MAG: hypothetical protein C0501_23485 [Isosphaera sp.]|nr:hypothetical protein [Isosphaera sp.]
MAACPHCRFPNPDPAGACGRCGGELSGVPAANLSAPLPAPMVEPIHAPPAPAPDSRPLPARPALTVPLAADPGATRVGPAGTAPAHPGLPQHPMNDAAVQSPPMTIPATAPAAEAPAPVPTPPPARPKLVVLRGVKVGAEYPIYEGRNTVGRFADKPVDIDLMSQESVEQIWCSRQHAVVLFADGAVAVEDLNSLNGTWVNGARIQPGQTRLLRPGDILQVGTVQMKLVLG